MITMNTGMMTSIRIRAKTSMIPMFESTFAFMSSSILPYIFSLIGSVSHLVSMNSPRAIDRNISMATMEFVGILTFHSVKNTMN